MKWNHSSEQTWYRRERWEFYDAATEITVEVASTYCGHYAVVATSGGPVGGLVLFNPRTLFDNPMQAREAGATWFHAYSEQVLKQTVGDKIMSLNVQAIVNKDGTFQVKDGTFQITEQTEPKGSRFCEDCRAPLVIRGAMITPDKQTLCPACYARWESKGPVLPGENRSEQAPDGAQALS